MTPIFLRAIRWSGGLATAALFGLSLLAPGAAHAAPLARPAQQGVNASGIITNGQGTCFPDAVLLDCNGAVIRQLKGPGGAAFFSPYLGQWVDLNGAETACAAGGSYLNVVTMRAAPNPCPGGGQQQPTATPLPGATATPVGTAVPGAAGNLALGRAIKASSSQAGFPPENAIDGNMATWWASNPGRDPRYPARNPQWIYIDLGSPQQIQSVKIHWNAQHHARTYELYVWRDECRGWCFGGGTNVGDGDVDEWTAARKFETQYIMLNLLNPYLMGQDYEIKEWEIYGVAPGAPAANSARGKAATALSADPAFPAANVTDGDLATEWRSIGGAPTWLYVDLGVDTTLNRVVLHWSPGLHATQYTLYSWNGRSWAPFHTQRAGAGGDETVNVWTLRTRYILLYANAAAGASVGLREFEVFDMSTSGGGGAPGLPTPPAPPPPPIPLLLEGRTDLTVGPQTVSRPLVRPAGAAAPRLLGPVERTPRGLGDKLPRLPQPSSNGAHH